MIIQSAVKKIVKSFGFNIERRSIAQSYDLRLLKILNDFKINLVYDVGANHGQFAMELISNNFLGKIVSFEPVSSSHDVLLSNSNKFKNWVVEERCALGERNLKTQINISASSASSSILKMTTTHLDAAPYTVNVSSENVIILKMDNFYDKYECESSCLFIKIDTQGFEHHVLKGGLKSLKIAKVLQLELSIVELYEGQTLMLEMIRYLENLGFKLWGLDPAFVDVKTGQMLQIDAIFIKNDSF
jgi:FkbM family methyltransferase